jgi:hypothetical protein
MLTDGDELRDGRCLSCRSGHFKSTAQVPTNIMINPLRSPHMERVKED